MSKSGAYSYEDEIDLYGDVEARPDDDTNGNGNDNNGESSKIGQEEDNSRTRDENTTSSIPTFISEARGGTGRVPTYRENSAGPSAAGGDGATDADGQGPRRGDYGSPGQWSTKPISTVRPSDMPDEGQVAFSSILMLCCRVSRFSLPCSLLPSSFHTVHFPSVIPSTSYLSSLHHFTLH